MPLLVPAHLPSLPPAELLVVGGGTAGCCAALAARESAGATVLLIERQGFLGGTSTGVLDTFYGFFTPGAHPRKVVGGIPDRVVDALDRVGAVFLRPNTYGAGTGVNYNPERLKRVWDELLAQAGVRVLLHAILVDVLTEGSGQITGVVLLTRQGFVQVSARRFIDASGDAVLCHHAGIDSERAGDLEPAQTLTTTFRLAAVDLDAYERAGGKSLLMAKMAEAVDRGTHALPRKSGSLHRMNVSGCVSTVCVRVAGLDPNDSEQLTAAEQEGRRQAFIYEEFLRDCIPGFGDARIIGLSHQIGIRETRRVYGEYRLTRGDAVPRLRGTLRRADRGPSRRSGRHGGDRVGLRAGQPGLRRSLPNAGAAGSRRALGRGSLLQRHPRCPCFVPVHGPDHESGRRRRLRRLSFPRVRARRPHVARARPAGASAPERHTAGLSRTRRLHPGRRLGAQSLRLSSVFLLSTSPCNLAFRHE